MNVPQFGEPQAGLSYPDRPAAFVVVERDGKIAVARVTFASGGGRLDLPGGGLDPGETAAQAAERECGEEVGLQVVAQGQGFTRADHFFVNEDGSSVNTRGTFFTARLVAAAPQLKIEEDHALEWMTPHEALTALDRDSHVWAVAAWLRLRARA
ncbi:MAG TPA: NUDIX domain-containing protein [Phenylobacterium sp.]|jgi:8-oxo-dGTP diphosphatase|uniref:NUDIX domain-containing protein n=1 Tax=Phenylobacterium sp. TaxID=1871053 RepID=UPI002D67EB0B|nr:NUDIX domain-containing protein [Phenylobacterium sp.]HZZ68338.1 NUDIX domain-containing protein [Phenylobacterium sp.]